MSGTRALSARPTITERNRPHSLWLLTFIEGARNAKRVSCASSESPRENLPGDPFGGYPVPLRQEVLGVRRALCIVSAANGLNPSIVDFERPSLDILWQIGLQIPELMASPLFELRNDERDGVCKPVHGWKKVALPALVAALALVTVQSARMGIAGSIAELAQLEFDHWRTVRQDGGMREANRIAAHFSDSLAYVGDNPWALEGLATLDLARMRLSKGPAEALALARDARMRYRQALEQRPTSPFLWANLALAKLFLDEFDEEFFAALRHADGSGPWEPSTQQVVLFVGLASWQKLDPEMRRSIGAAIERGGVSNGLKMFEIVKSFGRFDLVCGLGGYDAIAGAECRRQAAQSSPRPTSKGNP